MGKATLRSADPRTPARRAGKNRERPDASGAGLVSSATGWRGVLVTGAVAAVVSVVLIVVQVVVLAFHPPPQNAAEVFALMHTDPVLGLVSMDVLYLVNNVFVALLYLAISVLLFPWARSLVAIALTLGLLGIAAYFGSNPAVELLHLSDRAVCASMERQAALLSVGEGLLDGWRGTAFLTYYFLGAAALLLFAVAMLRSQVFSRATGVTALLAGILMLVPSTFGAVGMVFSLLSLLPWSVMCLLVAHRIVQLAQLR